MPNTNNRLKPMSIVNLTEDKTIKESSIRDFLYDHPEVLGEAIGVPNLQPIEMEKRQPAGGRLDLLFRDEDNARYEVELQLGATDESHIIRSIEYWDNERKRDSKHEHIAILIAEEITGRFFNVIQLFNSSIPMIALQLTAIPLPTENKVGISLIKVLDLVDSYFESDSETEAPTTDRDWWNKRSNATMMKLMDDIFEEIGALCEGCSLKYNKFYIGLVNSDNIPKNFITFVPQKGKVILQIYCNEDHDIYSNLQTHLDIERKERRYYQISFSDIKSFNTNKEDICKLIENAKNKRGI